MPEPPHIDNTVNVGDNHGQVTGTESGQHHQNVNVNVSRESSPETQNASYRELQLMMLNAQQSTNSAIQHLEERFYEWRKANERVRRQDDQDRRDRQHDTDKHRTEIMSRIDEIELTIRHIMASLNMLRGLAIALTIIDIWLIWDLVMRWQ